MMTAYRSCHLERIDHARNMRRFYALSIEQTLLGEIGLLRRWGRIGTFGRQRMEIYEQVEAAISAFDRMVQVKQGRGYRWRA